MKEMPIRRVVLFVAMILTLVPTVTAFFAIEGVIDSVFNMTAAPEIETALETSGNWLKRLKILDPSQEPEYREAFENLQTVRQSYSASLVLGPAVKKTYVQAFGILLGLALLFAFSTAYFLNRRIVRSYESAISLLRSAERRSAFLETSESWKKIAQSLVHEIRNPLTPIQMMIGRLPGIQKSGKIEMMAEAIKQAREVTDEEIAKITRWIDSFAKFARTPEPVLNPTTIQDLTQSVLEQSRAAWPDANFFLVGRLSDKVMCDRALAKQALYNLIKNAVEASGSQIARVRIEAKLASKNSVTIAVSDNGPGIPESMKDLLFNPFITTKSKDEGRGLGLALSRKLLREQGGDLILVSGGPGAVFEITLPMAD